MNNYAYAYAEIDDATHMCICVDDTSNPNFAGPSGNGTTWIAIPEYNEEYLLKYYDFNTGKWYLESTFETEWSPE